MEGIFLAGERKAMEGESLSLSLSLGAVIVFLFFILIPCLRQRPCSVCVCCVTFRPRYEVGLCR